MTITPKQCRAARAMLNMSQPVLAERCGVHIQTISKFEKNTGSPSNNTLEKISDALELCGLEFIDGGVREVESHVVLHGTDGFNTFLDDVYQTALNWGTEKDPCKIYVCNASHKYWVKWAGDKQWEKHVERMGKIKKQMDARVIVKEGDLFFPSASYSEYRWFSEKVFNDKSFYSYYDKLAFLNFKDNDVTITIIRQMEFAEGYCALFETAWDNQAKIPPKV